MSTEQASARNYPPGPKHVIPLAVFLAYRRGPLSFFQKLAREFGDIAYFRLANQAAFFLNHPDYIKDVLVTNNHLFMKGIALQRAKRLLGEGLLTSEGDFHRRQRRLAQPAFHRARVATYADLMSAYADQMSNRWSNGEVLDISVEMMRLTLAIVGKTLFDADVESDATEVGEAMTVVMELFNTVSIPFYHLIEKLPLPQTRRFDSAKARLDAIIYRLIDERRKSGRDHGDLLSMLLLSQDSEPTDGQTARMSNEQLRDELMTIFLAGHETTANALTWTWYLLSQNPDVESKMHEEIDQVFEREWSAANAVAELPYTEMVLAESMRLYPPAWALGRMSLDDYQINNYLIPKGSLVVMSQYVMHHDRRYFPEPERFDPQRWTLAARESRPQFSYFPFGGGPRRCIGENFALMEGVLLLATLARRWKMRVVPDHRVDLKPVMTLRPKYGMRMTCFRRAS